MREGEFFKLVRMIIEKQVSGVRKTWKNTATCCLIFSFHCRVANKKVSESSAWFRQKSKSDKKMFYSDMRDGVFSYVWISSWTIKMSLWIPKKIHNNKFAKNGNSLMCRGDWKGSESLWHHIKNCQNVVVGKFIFSHTSRFIQTEKIVCTWCIFLIGVS